MTLSAYSAMRIRLQLQFKIISIQLHLIKLLDILRGLQKQV